MQRKQLSRPAHRDRSFPDQPIEIEASPTVAIATMGTGDGMGIFFNESRNGGVSICIKTFAISQNITSTFTYLLCLGRGKCRSEKV